MSKAFKQEYLDHYYRMGARLARTGGWTVAEADWYAMLIEIGPVEREQMRQGLSDEHKFNPQGIAGKPLGAPHRMETA